MASKRDIKVLTELLDLDNIKVRSHRLHDGIGIILQTESKKIYSNCPRCGTKSHRLHQNHRHIVKDLPCGEKPVFLEVNRRQFKCEICEKPFSEELDFVSKKRTYTKRLANQTIKDVLENDIHSVASKGIVTTEEIERMLKDASEVLTNLKPLNLKILGIDEIALNKGHGNYCAVLIDLDTSKVIARRSQKYFPNSNSTIIRWFDEIIAYFDNRTTIGTVEGINNKLKLIKRSAYGFRNFHNFQIRCLLNWHFNFLFSITSTE